MNKSKRVCRDCQADVTTVKGIPLCDDCRASLKEARRVRESEQRSERAKIAVALNRKCECGQPAVNTRGVPRCSDCKGVKPKHRDCVDCGKGFKTTNNSTRCNKCGYKRNREIGDRRCTNCNTVIDRRSVNCPRCAPRGQSQVVAIGTRYVHPKTGYVDLKTERGWLREHTVVMEQHLGRKLVAGENVHHKNGNRADNRLENLELWAKPQPSGVRAVDLLAWAREIVARYEGTVIDQ